MRFLRHPPCPPGSLLPSTDKSMPTKTPTMGGMISRFQLRTRAHPRRADGGHPRCTCATHGSQPLPAKTARCDHGSRHHSSTVLTAYAYVVLRSTQSWSRTNSCIQQNAVNKRISKGEKTNPNSNVLFEVRIFELRLTSLNITLIVYVMLCSENVNSNTQIFYLSILQGWKFLFTLWYSIIFCVRMVDLHTFTPTDIVWHNVFFGIFILIKLHFLVGPIQ